MHLLGLPELMFLSVKLCRTGLAFPAGRMKTPEIHSPYINLNDLWYLLGLILGQSACSIL